MAKKKEPIEAIEINDASEVVVESVEENTEPKDPFADEFVFEQLKVINRIPDRAKAKRLADRIQRNRKG